MNVREGMRRFGMVLGFLGAILGVFLGFSNAQDLWNGRSAYRRFKSVVGSPTMQKVAKAALDYQKQDKLPTNEDQILEYLRSFNPNYDVNAALNAGASKRQVIEYLASKDQSLDALYDPKGGRILENPDLWLARQTSAGRIDYDALAKGYGAISPQPQKANTRGFTPPPLSSWQGPATAHKDDIFDRIQREELQKVGGIVVSLNLDGVKEVTVDKAGLVSSIELMTGELIQRSEPPQLISYLGLLLYPALGFLLPWACIRILVWIGTGFGAPRHSD